MSELSNWQGRDDTASEGPLALRWHQAVQAWQPNAPPGFTLLGFPCDEGVRRNQGRIGAAGAPAALRTALSNLAWHQSLPLYDAGDVNCHQDELEAAQEQLGTRVASLLAAGQRPIVLGGGHETAWGTFLGLVAQSPKGTVGIINIDAHFDLRASAKAHSGSSFAQMADWCHANNQPFHYLCLGIAEAANTAALFERATSLKAQWITDEELTITRYQLSLKIIEDFINQVDILYLSIDLDVLPLSTMSAVSAPAVLGVPLEVVMHLIQLIANSGKLRIADIVEYNPLLDDQQYGAWVAARLIWHLTRHWQPLRDQA
jgi:formiminoglutamase